MILQESCFTIMPSLAIDDDVVQQDAGADPVHDGTVKIYVKKHITEKRNMYGLKDLCQIPPRT